jgi:glycosyltransferase involved in cell wall biosynthesis
MKNSKSILLIGNMAGRMGAGQAVCETLQLLLQERGWQVFIASPYKARLRRLFDMLRTAYVYRKSYSLAVIDTYSGKAFVWAEIVAFLLRLLKKPYILALYGGNLPNFAKGHPERVRRLFHSAKIVISPSEYTRVLMLPYRSDIRVLSYGVDHSSFHFRERTKPTPDLITIRAFHNIYNLSMAPKVLAKLVGEFPDARLVMTGGNKHDGSWELVQDTAQNHGVADRVSMLGFVSREELPSLLDQAGVLLNTPNVDNTPVSLLEAMACGLCIVSTNVGGIPYLLDDGINGLLVPPDNPDAMAAAVRQVLTDTEFASNLSLNARKKAEQFDWSVLLPQWEKLFVEVAQN